MALAALAQDKENAAPISVACRPAGDGAQVNPLSSTGGAAWLADFERYLQATGGGDASTPPAVRRRVHLSA